MPADAERPATRLAMTDEDRRWTYALLGGGGLALFLAAPWLAGWLREVEFVPFHAALDWVGDLTQWWAWLLRPAVGLALGVVAAVVVLSDEHVVEVADDELRIIHGNDVRRVRREHVVGVHRDAKKLIIDGTQGRRLFREEVEAPRDDVARAFVAHGYPWEGDPPGS